MVVCFEISLSRFRQPNYAGIPSSLRWDIPGPDALFFHFESHKNKSIYEIKMGSMSPVSTVSLSRSSLPLAMNLPFLMNIFNRRNSNKEESCLNYCIGAVAKASFHGEIVGKLL